MGHGKNFDEKTVVAPGAKWNKAIGIFGIAGIAFIAIACFTQPNKAQFMHSYLTSFMLFLSITLGALGFTMINHITRAGWSVTVRRIQEGFMKNIWLMALLFLPILFFANEIFSWADSRDGETLKADLKLDTYHFTDAHHGHDDHAEEAHGEHDDNAHPHEEKVKEVKKEVEADKPAVGGHPEKNRVRQQEEISEAQDAAEAHIEGEEEEEAHSEGAHTAHDDHHAAGGRFDLAHGRHRAHLEHSLHVKHSYLNKSAFTQRAIIYFIIWIALAFFMFKKSTSQDADGNPKTTILMGKASAPGLMLYALSLTFASFDWMMSLDYAWFSTIYGVIYFAGGIMSMHAATVLAVRVLQAKGYLQGAVDQEHYHDLGKLMWAFMIFWTYTALSQYLIIWYADIPEETIWFLNRYKEGWLPITYIVIASHFLIPFAFFMSRHMKRNKNICAFFAAWLIIAEFIYIYWQVMPTVTFPITTPFSPSIADALIFFGMAGVYVAAFLFNLKNQNLIPVRDPRLKESVNFVNL
ncbi:hypothetical protein LNTAR_03394 [Lentisphaera araneosa HTCC2155]|uniref:Quinol:cytochrome C oxidoreductase n=1 Tax=Lentisphaera araneosa HTCC2155 TaxID=313628 RepID=A6DUB4_9BACT|nr:hypothetical protein [Lentisphaera araneosa]EDM24777.1 hypothetical protein LNTAR_03394 [Lentisphaera araneosa HTCC2155]